MSKFPSAVTIFSVSMKKIINWNTTSIIGVMSSLGGGRSVPAAFIAISPKCIGASPPVATGGPALDVNSAPRPPRSYTGFRGGANLIFST
jgi:hypothetical protein